MTADKKQALADLRQALIDEIVISGLRDDVRQWKQRAEAAEAKLSALQDGFVEVIRHKDRLAGELNELAKQEPVGYVSDNSAQIAASGRLGYISNHQVAGLAGRYVYARPAPAADLVPEERTWQDATNMAEVAGWNACRAAILRKIEEAK